MTGDDDFEEMVSSVFKATGSAWASTAANSTLPGTFSIDSLKAAVAAMDQAEADYAHRFNDRFVKPKGFDLDRGDLMFVGRSFDITLIPGSWHKQVLRSPLLHPFDMCLMAGTEPHAEPFASKFEFLFRNQL